MRQAAHSVEDLLQLEATAFNRLRLCITIIPRHNP
jgi:hypothetical protein